MYKMNQQLFRSMGLSRTKWIGGGGGVMLPASCNSNLMRLGRLVLLEVLLVQCVTELFEERVQGPT